MATTYRLTEHQTAGGMSRTLPYLAELQPEFFCEVSPELAAERDLSHLGWATIITARTAIEARVLVTERMRAIEVQGRRLHQVGLPYHWGVNGLGTGDSANDLLASPWTRTCTSRRQRRWLATSGRGAGRAGPPCCSWCGGTAATGWDHRRHRHGVVGRGALDEH